MTVNIKSTTPMITLEYDWLIIKTITNVLINNHDKEYRGMSSMAFPQFLLLFIIDNPIFINVHYNYYTSIFDKRTTIPVSSTLAYGGQ